MAASLLLVGVVALSAIVIVQNPGLINAKEASVLEPALNPIGQGKGIFPGRVVWVYDPDATDATITNTGSDLWSSDDNCDQSVVDDMLSEGLQAITGEETDADAWDALFRHFNSTHGNGDAGYVSGEKIVIKTNNNGWTEQVVITSPQVTYAVLDHLVNIVGVAQEDISIGDPSNHMQDVMYDKCHADFPDITYWTTEDNGAPDGRVPIVKSSTIRLNCSDGSTSSRIPQPYIDAKYMINLPVFKAHHRAGISIAAKNHFGSLTEDGSAFHLHGSLPCGDDDWTFSAVDPDKYRIFVDIMGHKHLGGKTMLYIADGLWGSNNWDSPPIKFRYTPFNDDYPSSLFISQDPVALESVCFDFLYEEFDPDHYGYGGWGDMAFPHVPQVDEFLHQAADPSTWPSGVVYDPENDGSALGSLGVHEHWNNSTDKQYSGNLGSASGIQLIGAGDAVVITSTDDVLADSRNKLLGQNYPNPFSNYTTIYYEIEEPAEVVLNIYNMQGQLVTSFNEGMKTNGHYEIMWDGINNMGEEVTAGMYIYTLALTQGNESFEISRKLMISK